MISRHAMEDLAESQAVFDHWWHIYNYDRPHDALQLDTPHHAMRTPPAPFRKSCRPITYEPEDLIRKVDKSGKIYFRNRYFRVGKAFRHQPVALRPPEEDGI